MNARNAIACFVLSACIGTVHAQPSSPNPEPAAKSSGAKVSVWNGVYTGAQGNRGEKVQEAACVSCHGPRFNGAGQPDMPPSPAIAGATFLFKWKGKTLAELFDYVRTKMPPDNPGTLSAQDSVDAVAHMFAVSKLPAGDKELPPDPSVLAGIVIEDKPK